LDSDHLRIDADFLGRDASEIRMRSDLPFQHGFQDVTMTIRLIFRAMAEERHRDSLGQGLQQPQRKLLAMIFYDAVPLV